MMQVEGHVLANDDSDVITSTDIETAINLAPHSASSDVELKQEVVDFLITEGESPKEVLSRPIVGLYGVDDSLPLTNYFISTSHNTYLLSLQLFGTVSAMAYTHVLSHHCRCVEIDVWPPKDTGGQPIVTHGHTFSQHMFFRDVCVAIGDAVHPGAWPVMVSLECHLDVPDQDKIVRIMKEVWGEKLVKSELRGLDSKNVSPRDLRGRIVLMVEYYPSQSVEDVHAEALDSVSGDAGDDLETHEVPRIGSALRALGVYAHSVKPRKDWLTKDILEPPHILYNLSESTLGKLLPASLPSLVTNSLVYMRRVYPKFTRITSSNLDPLKHWRSGTHAAALNWQRYDKGVQINEGMFVGSNGWVLKPERLLGNRPFDSGHHIGWTCEVVAGCNIPIQSDNCKAYVRAELFVAGGDEKWESRVVHTLSSNDPTLGNFVWRERIDWKDEKDELSFVRISVYRSEFGKDDRLGTFCARLQYLLLGWRFIRLFDKKGKHNGGLLLVRFSR